MADEPSQILRNEKYAGTYVFNKTSSKFEGKRNQHKSKDNKDIIKIVDGIPCIIDKELFERIQVKMSENLKSRATNKAKEIYLISGLLFCGECGGAMVGNRKECGRNKDLYVTYECNTRKRKKTCTAKSINRDLIENQVIDEVFNKLLSPQSIDKIADKIYEYSKTQNNEIEKDIKIFEKELVNIKVSINNIINAISDGMFHPSMKIKMDELEQNKANLELRIVEAKFQAELTSPSKEMITQYISKGTEIENKSSEDIKKILQAYVQKVIVFETYFDIHLIVDINGGGEGCRTPVRKQ